MNDAVSNAVHRNVLYVDELTHPLSCTQR